MRAYWKYEYWGDTVYPVVFDTNGLFYARASDVQNANYMVDQLNEELRRSKKSDDNPKDFWGDMAEYLLYLMLTLIFFCTLLASVDQFIEVGLNVYETAIAIIAFAGTIFSSYHLAKNIFKW